MPNPKKRTSHCRRNTRRAHLALLNPNVGRCENCNGIKLPHRVCPHCGFYKNRKVIEISGSF